MKSIKSLASAALLLAVSMGFTSCSDDDDNKAFVVSFNDPSITMDSKTSAWADVMKEGSAQLYYSCFSFSHSVTVTEWGGTKYYSWDGFCPSTSSDVEDRSEAGDWVDHQWGAITGKGLNPGKPYMLAYWNSWDEMSLTKPDYPSLAISYAIDSKVFAPQSVAITNSTWVYYALKKGSAPAVAFGDNDYLYLYINGVKDGKVTGTVTVTLAKGKDILDTWETVDLTSLGDVNSIYFQMKSSDSSEMYGMNTPAYFCLDNFEVIVK